MPLEEEALYDAFLASAATDWPSFRAGWLAAKSD